MSDKPVTVALPNLFPDQGPLEGFHVTELHTCEGNLPEGGYGAAIEGCSEKEDGTLWAGNGEYDSQVAFCPYCGFAARIKPEVTSEAERLKGFQK
jgi:hypothetical protein